MGAKFYRGADKPKKIRKRLYQTRSWARTLKWVACIHLFTSSHSYRSCSPHLGCWTSIQGIVGPLYRTTLTPRSKKICTLYCCFLQTSLPRKEPLWLTRWTLSSFFRRFLPLLLRYFHISNLLGSNATNLTSEKCTAYLNNMRKVLYLFNLLVLRQ